MNTRNLVQSPVMSAYGENWGLIGHEWAVDLLARRLAAGRVGHAYLFTGMSGVGKSTLATRLAQAINCTGDTPPCGACRACTLTESGAHPDVSFVEGDKGAIKIEAIRDLQNFLSLQPFEARSRIGIILRGQELTAQAADALLKTLEEPAPGARLLLTASMVDSLAATIASRCQVIHLRGVPAAQIEAALRERTDCSPSEAALLAGLAGGRPGWALGAAQNPDVLAWRAEVLDQLLAASSARRGWRGATTCRSCWRCGSPGGGTWCGWPRAARSGRSTPTGWTTSPGSQRRSPRRMGCKRCAPCGRRCARSIRRTSTSDSPWT
jgi:DNA polymerase III delta' subunit